MRNRTDDTAKGGALVTMMRADVKADDHINANASPIRIARKSIALPGLFIAAYQVNLNEASGYAEIADVASSLCP